MVGLPRRSAALLTILVGGVWGEITPHFPPYVVEALLVEVVGLLVCAASRSPVVASARSPESRSARSAWPPSGAGRTSGWSIPWPASLLPEAAITGLIAAIAGGVIGGFIGRCLTPAAQRRERVPRPALAGAAVAAVGAIAFLIPIDTGPHVRATFDLNVRNSSDGRVATGTFRLDPPDAAKDAYWFNVTSWQGKDGPAHIDKPEQIGPGLYRITTSRSTSTAPGRRRFVCTMAASSPGCRSSCRPTRRSRCPRCRSRRT